jgi:hypothetical protein
MMRLKRPHGLLIKVWHALVVALLVLLPRHEGADERDRRLFPAFPPEGWRETLFFTPRGAATRWRPRPVAQRVHSYAANPAGGVADGASCAAFW